jgi:cell wall-associated NlpC family hydrolase
MSLPDTTVSARVADVQSRIAALQSKFGPAPSAGAPAGQFGNVLSEAVRTASPAATAGAAPAITAPGPGPGAAGERAVAIAKQQLGKPYVWGAESPSVGFDCSGLVQHTFKQLGIDLPRVSRDQARAGRAVASLADARPGDLIAFGSPVDHIGIYAGNNKMVVAPRSGDVVKVQEVYRTPTAIRRVI